MSRGNGATHDEILRIAIDELARTQDVVVLAQASMARLVDTGAPARSRFRYCPARAFAWNACVRACRSAVSRSLEERGC
jgi:hypothetical protein